MRRCAFPRSGLWRPATRSTSSCRCAPPTGSAGTSYRGTWAGPARGRLWTRTGARAGRGARSSEVGGGRRLGEALGRPLVRYAVERGSIDLDGVSLTVAAVGEGWVEVSLIPETLERTNLGRAVPGQKLNVECDVVAKYVERLVSPFAGKKGS